METWDGKQPLGRIFLYCGHYIDTPRHYIFLTFFAFVTLDKVLPLYKLNGKASPGNCGARANARTRGSRSAEQKLDFSDLRRQSVTLQRLEEIVNRDEPEVQIHKQGCLKKVVLPYDFPPNTNTNASSIKGTDSNNHTLQRKIRISFAQYLNGETPTKDKTDRYYDDFIFHDYREATSPEVAKQISTEEIYKDVIGAHIGYRFAYLDAMHHMDWQYLPATLNELKDKINIVLAYAKDVLKLSGIKSEYDHDRSDSWKDSDEALKSMSEMAEADILESIKPKTVNGGKDHPNIPVIGWSGAKSKLPSSLRNLIRDIYTSWRIGLVFDERDETSRNAREKNPNVEGGLRSWHVNEQSQLPDNSKAPIPNSAQGLHDHYVRYSKHPYKTVRETRERDKPTGYAEYTGSGIKGDWHYSKIVLDYKSGIVYLTVTHYALWSKKGMELEVGDKTPGSGTNSAWFAFDMTR